MLVAKRLAHSAGEGSSLITSSEAFHLVLVCLYTDVFKSTGVIPAVSHFINCLMVDFIRQHSFLQLL